MFKRQFTIKLFLKTFQKGPKDIFNSDFFVKLLCEGGNSFVFYSTGYNVFVPIKICVAV